MSRWPRGALPWLVLVTLGALVHQVAGRLVGAHDLVAVVLMRRDLWVLLAVAILLVTRGFLFLLAPGWALYLLVRDLIERRRPAG